MAGGANSPDFGSAQNLIFSLGTLFVILVIQYFANGFFRSLAVLFGIIAGTIAYSFVNPFDFSTVAKASRFHLPAPFYFPTSVLGGATVVPKLFSSLPAGLKTIVGDGLIIGSLTAIFLNFFLSFKVSKKEKIKTVSETSLVSQGGN